MFFCFFPLQKYPVAVIEHNLIILLKMPTPPFFWKTNTKFDPTKLVILTYDEGNGVRAVQAAFWYSLALWVKRVDGLKITKELSKNHSIFAPPFFCFDIVPSGQLHIPSRAARQQRSSEAVCSVSWRAMARFLCTHSDLAGTRTRASRAWICCVIFT